METKPAPSAYEQVAALFGHELSMPLATALLYIGIAETHCGLAPSGVRSALQVARREVQRLKALVDTLTELERFGRPTLQPRAGDLGTIVRAAVNRALATSLDAQVEVTIEPSRPLAGWWDHAAVEQIVANLLSNAMKFGQGHPIRVEARHGDGGTVVISVSDRGVGVAAGDRARIFERNIRAPARHGGGLGLGLWLVRELAWRRRPCVAAEPQGTRDDLHHLAAVTAAVAPQYALPDDGPPRDPAQRGPFRPGGHPAARRSRAQRGGAPVVLSRTARTGRGARGCSKRDVAEQALAAALALRDRGAVGVAPGRSRFAQRGRVFPRYPLRGCERRASTSRYSPDWDFLRRVACNHIRKADHAPQKVRWRLAAPGRDVGWMLRTRAAA